MELLLQTGIILGVLGLILIAQSALGRWMRGLALGSTVALNNVNLYSERLQLSGRVDRLVKRGNRLIPEEWKSSERMRNEFVLQLGAYFLLIEEVYGSAPKFGFVVLGNGERIKIENTKKLRSEVLLVAGAIRSQRKVMDKEIEVEQPPQKCRACGQRRNCLQAKV